jgi:hypothetical protein
MAKTTLFTLIDLGVLGCALAFGQFKKKKICSRRIKNPQSNSPNLVIHSSMGDSAK